MRIVWTGVWLALAAAPLSGQAEAGPPRMTSVSLPAELARVLRDYEREWAEGDAEGLAALFVPDGFVADRLGWIRGRDGIVQRYEDAGGPLRLRALAFAEEGDVAWIVGAYGYGEMADEVDSGKFVLALRRGPDGRWLIAADLDRGNSAGPPGG